MDEKARIRKKVLAKRDSLDLASRQLKDSLIKKRFFSLPEFEHAGVVLYFSSFRTEVGTLSHIQTALERNKRIVVPLVDAGLRELILYEITSPDELIPGYMGIPEPHVSEERRRTIDDVDLVVLPGAAFDSQGNRLGYGGGYYDKLLSRLKKRIPLIALAYEEQIVDALPSDPHDIRVHKIVTDKRSIDCRTH